MKNRRYFNNLFGHDRKILYIILSIVMISVLTLTVVYAALSTTLNINGNAEVSAASWDIYFDNIQINENSVEAIKKPTRINSKIIDFSVALKEPGDFYKFTVDIVNNGSIDAMIDSIVKMPELTSQQSKYIKYEIEYSDGVSMNEKQLLEKYSTKTINVLLAYRSDVATSDIPTEGESLNLTFTVIYTQADDFSTEIPQGTEIKILNGNLNTIGSEICIDTECFYLINNDGSSITMLSKYNLYVGGEYNPKTSTLILYGDDATGLQHPEMTGWLSSETIRKGVLSFSDDDYWYNNGLKAEYGTSYPAYVYDSNCNLYNPVENYKKHLETLGVMIEEARLITYNELVKLGCTNNAPLSCTSSYKWIYSTTYWMAEVGDPERIWNVDRSGAYGYISYDQNRSMGVRPVIKIPLYEFN